MTLQLLHSEFPHIWGKFDFLFYQCIVRDVNDGHIYLEYQPWAWRHLWRTPVVAGGDGARSVSWHAAPQAGSVPVRAAPVALAELAQQVGGQAALHALHVLVSLPLFWTKHENFELPLELVLIAYSNLFHWKNSKRTRHKNYTEFIVRLLNEIERKMQKWETKLLIFCLEFSVQYHTNKSYLGRRLRDQKIKLFDSKMEADIRHFVFRAHAECVLLNVAHAHHALESNNLFLFFKLKKIPPTIYKIVLKTCKWLKVNHKQILFRF